LMMGQMECQDIVLMQQYWSLLQEKILKTLNNFNQLS
jgi:hypothetical protein